MKRDPRLSGLSSEHHQALVLARWLSAAGDAFGEEEGAALGQRFDRELEPHFRVEEECLLPALMRAGAAPLVERTLRDHAFLREQAVLARAGLGAAARALGERLQEHVRFEERELFPACEELLQSAVLETVSQRAPKRGT